MKRRYAYLLLFGAPALMVSLIISFLLFGATAGVLWIFVLGDNPWPPFTEKILAAAFVVACLALGTIFMSVAFVVGKNQEQYPSLNPKHIMISVGASVLALLFIVLHQWGVGNIGTRTESELCSAFCQDKGFRGSGMPPKNAGASTCSCYDAQGGEAVRVPIGDVTAPRGK
jgi:hypothetical protein